MGKLHATQSLVQEPENRAGLAISGASYPFWSPGGTDAVVTVVRCNLTSPETRDRLENRGSYCMKLVYSARVAVQFL